ncbi:MAG: hypothetical protein CBD16_07090 [Betaproteobacteria bacterium TMED156]|nr:MAG: hypothetical protein CBD16_07090 [Betaproteobacteria bacterium TMED156]
MQQAPKGRNVAGIIPLSGWKDSFDFPWPDYLHPLREGFLAVERSVYECALAGCDSIWIVCNDNLAPLVKTRLGDYVVSPRYFEEKNFVKRKDYHEKWIPIYYTPILQKDRNRRDSIGWSVLHGALTSFLISDKLSRWVLPTKYFVSFPYGIYDPQIARKHRDAIRGPNSFFFSHEGKTARDNKYLAFTFFPSDWPKFKWNIKNQCTGGDSNLPPEDRWSGKNFALDKIFNIDIITVDKKIEIKEYYSLETWQSLVEYYKSDLKIYRPGKQFMKPYIFNKEGKF